jgi:hypothetical protein
MLNYLSGESVDDSISRMRDKIKMFKGKRRGNTPQAAWFYAGKMFQGLCLDNPGSFRGLGIKSALSQKSISL